MKNHLLLSLLPVMLTFLGCNAERLEYLQISVNSPSLAVERGYLAVIEQLGFGTDGIIVTDSAYLVEGDVVIPKEHIEQIRAEPATRQNYYGADRLASNANVRNVRIAIRDYSLAGDDPQYTPMMACTRQLDGAIAAFNNLPNCVVKITIVTESESHDILICAGSQFTHNSPVHQEIMCASELPWNGSPGRYIWINTQPYPPGAQASWRWSTITSTKIKTALTHAIGHCLGLAHTNTTNSAYPAAILEELTNGSLRIEGSLKSDDQSIMNLEQHTYWNAVISLSDSDKEALSTLYPKYALKVSGPTSVFIGENYTYTIDDDKGSEHLPPDAVVTWSVTGGKIVSQPDRTIIVEIEQRREHEVRATVKVGDATYKATSLKLTATAPPLSAGTVAPAVQTITRGTRPEALTSSKDASGGAGTIVYQWQSRFDSQAWEDIKATNSIGYHPYELVETTYYRRKAMAEDESVFSNTVTVKVNPAPRYNYVYIKRREDSNDCFTITGRGVVYTGTGKVYFYSDSDFNNPIPFLEQTVLINVKRYEATTPSTTYSLVEEFDKYMDRPGYYYELPRPRTVRLYMGKSRWDEISETDESSGTYYEVELKYLEPAS